MMEVNKKICKKSKQELDEKRYLQKGTLAFSGYCGKSIIVKADGRISYHDDIDCPKCPTFIDPIEYAERSLKNS